MTEPIEIRFRVDCPPAHAFATWTERAATWWPPGHSRSGDPDMRLTIEPGIGGRIVERTPAGEEHVWGEVVAWEPPRRLAWLWHIYGPREQATLVELTFEADGDATRVRLHHSGWEALQQTRPDLRGRNETAWSHVLTRFAEACGTPTTRSAT